MDTASILANALTDKTMELAIKDKKAEYEKVNQNNAVEKDDLDDDDDPELNAILQKMKQSKMDEANKRSRDDDDYDKKETDNKNVWYGEYQEIVEEEFLPYVTKAENSVCHFYHNDFERCKIIDKHLNIIAQKHKETKFLKLNAEKAPFFIAKLQIKVLPTICMFKKGVLCDKLVGFEGLGGTDDFKTIDLIRRMVKLGILKPLNDAEKGFKLKRGQKQESSDSEDDDY